ncbi:MAG: hypothetical protein R3F54_28705 [Alphaproteobacteria bacterium]
MIKEPIMGFDVTRDDHAFAWQASVEHLRGSIATLHGTHEEVDILTMLHQGVLHLWQGVKASGITEIQVYPRKSVCNVFLAGGKGGLSEILEWVKRGGLLEKWAFDRWRCDWISYTGRHGWAGLIECEPLGEVAMRMRP